MSINAGTLTFRCGKCKKKWASKIKYHYRKHSMKQNCPWCGEKTLFWEAKVNDDEIEITGEMTDE